MFRLLENTCLVCIVFSVPSDCLCVLSFFVRFFLFDGPQEAGVGTCASLLAAVQGYLAAGSRVRSSEVTSRLRVLAIKALREAPVLLAPFQAVGWDAQQQEFLGPLDGEALASLEASASSLLAAQAAGVAVHDQVFCLLSTFIM